MRDVAGKVAFITGGSSGIGLGIARAFLDAGMRVVITYRTPQHLTAAMDYLSDHKDVHAVRVDVGDRTGMKAAAQETLERFGKVHVLVNNAGVIVPRVLSETSYEEWDWLMNVNVTGVFNGIREFLPLIRSHGEGGQIISTSSVLGLFVWGSAEGIYPASKFAVTGMMETLRAELTGSNIGVSVFCPGWVNSSLGRWSRDTPSHDARQPLGTLTQEEIESSARQFVDSGLLMDPLETGQLVLRGMRRNDLYILTHPEWEQIMRDRQDALIAAIPRDTSVNDVRRSKSSEMTRNSIYAAVLTAAEGKP